MDEKSDTDWDADVSAEEGTALQKVDSILSCLV